MLTSNSFNKFNKHENSCKILYEAWLHFNCKFLNKDLTDSINNIINLFCI